MILGPIKKTKKVIPLRLAESIRKQTRRGEKRGGEKQVWHGGEVGWTYAYIISLGDCRDHSPPGKEELKEPLGKSVN